MVKGYHRFWVIAFELLLAKCWPIWRIFVSKHLLPNNQFFHLGIPGGISLERTRSRIYGWKWDELQRHWIEWENKPDGTPGLEFEWFLETGLVFELGFWGRRVGWLFVWSTYSNPSFHLNPSSAFENCIQFYTF